MNQAHPNLQSGCNVILQPLLLKFASTVTSLSQSFIIEKWKIHRGRLWIFIPPLLSYLALAIHCCHCSSLRRTPSTLPQGGKLEIAGMVVGQWAGSRSSRGRGSFGMQVVSFAGGPERGMYLKQVGVGCQSRCSWENAQPQTPFIKVRGMKLTVF